MAEKWEKAHKILCFEDLLEYRLGIKNPAIGWSLAGRTMMFDVLHHCWSNEITGSLGIKDSQLSRPLPSGTIAGYVDKKAAQALQINENTVVVTGGHDQVCSALGAGAVESGVAVYTSGTVDCITPAFKNPIFRDELRKNNLCTYDHAVPGMYATVAFSLTGGNILKWFRDNFGRAEKEEAERLKISPYELLLNQLPENPTNLLVFPYFTPSGTPYFDTSVKGAILGLDLSTGRAEIMKALLEGVALEMRLNLDILEKAGYEINELRSIGGGARSQVWNQLRADVTGKTINVPSITEAGCMGAAMLARTAVTGQSVISVANDWIKNMSVFRPQHTSFYDMKFESYKKLYRTLSKIKT